MRLLLVAAGMCVALSGCVVGYQLVKAEKVPVAQGAITVHPGTTWNKAPKGPTDIPQEEIWTQNGPLLDSITFFAGLRDGQSMTKQKDKDDRKVPAFHSDMNPQDLVAMVESYYRIRLAAQVFQTTSVKPATFLGTPGVQFDYDFVPADQVKRRGRSIIAVHDGKLYLIALDGTAVHYFDAALPEFQTIVASASTS
jgi:hypothetical protein